MSLLGSSLSVISVIVFCFHVSMATNDCELNPLDPNKVAYTINVGRKGNKDFTSIQEAIDSIPPRNNRWIRIFISHGTYMEKVEIPRDKGCIFMEGEKAGHTTISWGDYMETDASATFAAYADNILVKALSFKNAYIPRGDLKPALAARLHGDKYAFYDCEFVGLQDTVWDAEGRHYFKPSSIHGAVDFIWGRGQSIYEGCMLSVSLRGVVPQRTYGTITAQGRESESDPSGFVFKGCIITGPDRMLLGRAYRAYSRVIFYRCEIPDTVLPVGWDAWNAKGHENDITYVEAENNGIGASTSGRVGWSKTMSEEQLNSFTDLSYIDGEGWISRLPVGPSSIDGSTTWISPDSRPTFSRAHILLFSFISLFVVFYFNVLFP